jgi:hypothetical protein
MVEALLILVIKLCVIGFLAWLILWAIGQIPMPEPLPQVIRVIVVVVLVLIAVLMVLPLLGISSGPPLHLG